MKDPAPLAPFSGGRWCAARLCRSSRGCGVGPASGSDDSAAIYGAASFAGASDRIDAAVIGASIVLRCSVAGKWDAIGGNVANLNLGTNVWTANWTVT